eukprot:527013_1
MVNVHVYVMQVNVRLQVVDVVHQDKIVIQRLEIHVKNMVYVVVLHINLLLILHIRKKTADFTPPTCDFNLDAYIFTDSYVKNDGQFNAYETTIDRDTSSNDINLLIFGKGAYSDTSGSNALINERDNKQNKNVFGMENATPGATLGIWFLIFVGIAALVIIAITIGVKLKQKKKMDDIKIVIQPQSPDSPQEVTNDNNNDKETQITFEEENENGKNSDNEIENNIL